MRRRGQSTVEMMLYVSVISIALTAIAWSFIGSFKAGYAKMEADAETVIRSGMESGSGDKR